MSAIEAVLKRDRAVVLSGLVGISILAWAYMLRMAQGMAQMDMAMPRMQVWGVADLVMLFAMWAVMMVAMMVPSAAPVILTVAAIDRRRSEKPPLTRTGLFLAGYLVVWSGFSVAATAAQWGLHAAALLSPMMVSTSPLLGGALLLAAGVFQWTPLKRACLMHCRSPLDFLMAHWRTGSRGAFLMGVKHGSYCVGCCWGLMLLLFVAGVMNLLWVAAVTAFILAEKALPRGDLVGRIAGGALMLAGIAVFWQA